jgi:ABC-type multidrug transport system fused ATPase/permease subunit
MAPVAQPVAAIRFDPVISFRILGPLVVAVAGRAVVLGGSKPRLLLAAILLQPNVVVSTDALTEVLWPGSALRSAAANIRTYVHSLRRRLAEANPELEERIGAARAVMSSRFSRKNSIPHCSNAASPRPKPQRTHTRRSPLSAVLPQSGAVTCWKTFPLSPSHTWTSAVAQLTPGPTFRSGASNPPPRCPR